jgi:hypothetical protein
MKALPGDTRPLRHNTRWEKADTNKRRREIDIGTQNGAAAHRTYPQVDMKRTENQFTTDATTFASDLGLDQDEHYETNLEPGLDTHLLSIYPSIATSACYSVRSSLTPFRFGVSTGELTLSELYAQPYTFRKDIVEKGPYIDVYLGATRVYKRVSKALLYAFCRDIGRFLVCCNSRFIVQLPHGFSNVLSVKLAVGYMEESVLHPRFRSSPWKIPAYSSLCDYISLAELFTYIGCGDEANNLERAFVRRLREAPLSMEQVRNIWGRENLVHLSKYAEGMARNIVTWFCVPRLEVWMAQWDIFWDVKEGESTYKKEASGEHGDGGYAEGVEKKIRELAATYEVWKMDRKYVNILVLGKGETDFAGMPSLRRAMRRTSWTSFWKKLTMSR